jgi:biopolymer transport protein ExbB/TolQ
MTIATLASDIQQMVFDAARILLYPVLIGVLACLVWTLIELGVFLYEAVQRFRSRDLEALEAGALRARKAFAAGRPRAAYRHLQDNTYSIIVARFLFDLIRNYQTERLAAKPLKLLQEYEFFTVRRLERTRILMRVGPILGLMGAFIPLAPALAGLADGSVPELTRNLQIAFSIAVLGLFIGGLAFVITVIRDRMYAQDISDLEYLLELLEGNADRLPSGRRRDRRGRWDPDPSVSFQDVPDEAADATVQLQQPRGVGQGAVVDDSAPHVEPMAAGDEGGEASFDDPTMSWHADDDPFAALGPAEQRRFASRSAASPDTDTPSGRDIA